MADISKDLVNSVLITSEHHGQRLDNFLFKILKGVPKSHIQRIIRSGEVRINKKRCQATTRIQEHDILRIPPIRISTSETKFIPQRAFEIIYEDEVILVINKPHGIAVHGGSGVDFGVIEQLRQSRPHAHYLELVHRLDKETSGLLMIAKKRQALIKLHEAFRLNHPKKIYLALGVGHWLKPHKQVCLPLMKYQGSQGEKIVRVHPDGQYAQTSFRLIHDYAGSYLHQLGMNHLCLVEATLKTGRTHQIRVHMQSQHCPIAGDERYGDYRMNKRLTKLGLKRMFLHAHRLVLQHPITKECLNLEAPLPKELQQFLEQLAKLKQSSL